MKGIKKFFNILLLILLCFFAACANPITPEPEVPDEGISIQEALEEAIIELSENDSVNSVTSNLIFIEKYEDLYDQIVNGKITIGDETLPCVFYEIKDYPLNRVSFLYNGLYVMIYADFTQLDEDFFENFSIS